ncbi:cell division protein FtsQ/DivIB [Blattabacterium cuenoti]|uniref:cell division protein FtsQ/DivIB n=1 Tax=Blattabacterium cuenoti TaxID=1653831 RepID=UPI00163D2664|nr:cell division protein FtsQ [Blattabacterium cuenoti]
MEKYRTRMCITILYFTLISILFFFSQKTYKNRNLTRLNIIINPSYSDHVINENIVKNILFDKDKGYITKNIGQLCILRMEQKLNHYPFIKKSEIFLSVDGTLNIKIQEKTPILRIKNGKKKHYLTNDAESLEFFSSSFQPRVILAQGEFSKEEKRELVNLVNVINSDELLKHQIISIKKTKDNIFSLIPKIGNHYIILGNITNFRKKLKKLKAFYKQYLNKIDINQYRLIDLQYKNQVVAKKR